MARIQDTRGRTDENSGYARLFGNASLGQLVSRVHATVIRAGNELEALLQQRTPHLASSAVMEPHSPLWQSSPVQAIFRYQMPPSEGPGHTVDFLILRHQEKRAYAVEVKDGDTFDTKKATGELENLQKVADFVRARTGYDTTFHFCGFNQPSRALIVSGSKRRFSEEQAMTGQELCALLDVDFDALVTTRRSEQNENLEYLLKEMVEIPEARAWLEAKLL
jgi:hypothetical protein